MTDGEEEDGEGGPVPGYLTAQVNTSIPTTVSFNTYPNTLYTYFIKSANYVQVVSVMLYSLSSESQFNLFVHKTPKIQ